MKILSNLEKTINTQREISYLQDILRDYELDKAKYVQYNLSNKEDSQTKQED